jgi:prepilin-type N-terminal cleavage/methylation domain-containing protein
MPRRAFTLMELMVVMAVIIALAGISYPTFTWLRHRADVDSTVTLINAVSATIGGQPQRQVTFHYGTPPQMAIRPLWDFNGDGFLDGAPAQDDRFAASDRDLAEAANYTGFIGGTRAALPPRNVDAAKRVIDPWDNVLRIDIKAGTYGSSFFGLWSPGPDGIDGTDDDIRSWKKD